MSYLKLLAGTIVASILLGSSWLRAEKVLYVHKGLYDLRSPLHIAANEQGRAFDEKYPGGLEEYRRLTERLQSIPESDKKNRPAIEARIKELEAVMGKDFESLVQIVGDLTTQSEVLFAQSVQAVLKKAKADAIADWNPAWYYLTPEADATDLVLDETSDRRWNRSLRAQEFKPRLVLYVEQARLSERVAEQGLDRQDFARRFFDACAEVGRERGADLLVELRGSGFRAVRSDLDVTNDVWDALRRGAAGKK